jgi:hypothetical protein
MLNFGHLLLVFQQGAQINSQKRRLKMPKGLEVMSLGYMGVITQDYFLPTEI